jgi:hypothetical protein
VGHGQGDCNIFCSVLAEVTECKLKACVCKGLHCKVRACIVSACVVFTLCYLLLTLLDVIFNSVVGINAYTHLTYLNPPDPASPRFDCSKNR